MDSIFNYPWWMQNTGLSSHFTSFRGILKVVGGSFYFKQWGTWFFFYFWLYYWESWKPESAFWFHEEKKTPQILQRLHLYLSFPTSPSLTFWIPLKNIVYFWIRENYSYIVILHLLECWILFIVYSREVEIDLKTDFFFTKTDYF